MAIVWLASYPKSGNTWVRTLITNYLADADTPADINALGAGWSHLVRSSFDDEMGLASSDMLEAELAHYRALYHASLDTQRTSEEAVFIKTHEAFCPSDGGPGLFSAGGNMRAVHLLRDPRDVAVSYAQHLGHSLDRTIARMAQTDAVVKGGSLRFPEWTDSWSGFNRGWAEQQAVPVLTIRYEDMVADTATVFATILRFCGLEPVTERVERAVRFSRLDELQRQEAITPFRERTPSLGPFFRKGEIGGWHNDLSPQQAATICADHAETMHTFGYDTHLTTHESMDHDEQASSFSR